MTVLKTWRFVLPAEFQVPLNKAITELEQDILKEEILTYELIIASKDVHSQEFKGLEAKIEKLEHQTDAKIIEAEKLVEEAIAHSHDAKAKATYAEFAKALKYSNMNKHNLKNHSKRLKIIWNRVICLI